MDFNLSEEQRQLRDGAARFIREQYPFEKRRRLAEERGFSPRMWEQFAELGWLALGLPEEVGGLGCSFVESALLAEEFGRGLVLEPFVTTTVLCARLVERSTAFAHRATVLGEVAEGKLILALAHAETQGRYSLQAPRTTAAPSDAGAWRLSGLKTLVAGAPFAQRLIVSATHDGETALFLVDAQTPGLTLRPYALIDGTRAADVVLDNVAVPAGDVLCRGAETVGILEDALDRANLALAAEALGCMEAVMEITSEYLKTRQQFGQPIGHFQALQHRMSEMFVEAQEARSAVYRGLAAIDTGDLSERCTAVSAARVSVSAAGRMIGEQGIQLHGGIGMTDEYSVGHYYKRLLVIEKLFGDSDWHLDRYIAIQRAAA